MRYVARDGILSDVAEAAGLIEVRELSKKFGDKIAVNDLSFTVEPGRVTGFLGPNGAGKSTTMRLIVGLDRPTSGSATIDGLAYGQLRRPLTVVGALLEARVVIDGLALGYDTVLAREFKEGAELSGGQWQRIAAARAFYRTAPLLIMDEPTAALDARAEYALFSTLRVHAATRSVLIITHHLASVRQADRIYVLAKGRVIESGGHQELMALGGQYAELYTLQAAQYEH